MQLFKKKIFSTETEDITYVNFAYSESGTACSLSPSVFLYRNSIGNSFLSATLLAVDSNFITLAPPGFYAEHDESFDGVISRQWDGTEFVGLPEICG